MVALSTEFNKYYKQQLKAYGFIKLKGLPYFGKLINNEIFQFITFHNMNSLIKGKKAFTIDVGILTIYSKSLDKHSLAIWINPLMNFRNIDESLNERFDDIYAFYYDDQSISDTLAKTFEETKSIAFPYMDKILSLEDYIWYCKYMHIALLRNADQFYQDSLLLVKTNNHDDFLDIFEKQSSVMLKCFGNNPNDKDYLQIRKEYYKSIVEEIAQARDRVYDNPELYAKAMEELERRKQVNIETLKSYGIIF